MTTATNDGTEPLEITSIRKGDGHPHLAYGSATLCGRTLRENRWAKIVRLDAQLTAQLAAATLSRPWALDAVCRPCMIRVGILQPQRRPRG